MRKAALYATTIGLLLGTALLSALTSRRVPQALAVPLDQIPSKISGWTEFRSDSLAQGAMDQLRADSYLSRAYRKGGAEMGLFIAYYAQQRAGESMHSPKHCLPGAGWQISQGELVSVPTGKRSVHVNKYVISNLGNKMIMFYWYESGDRVFTSEYVGKLLLMRDAALTGHTAGSLVRILTPDVPSAQAQAVDFSSTVVAQMERCFGRTLD